jgi:phospholipase/carboxylesterase
MTELLETVDVETGPQPTAAVLWLHGLGADGHDFEPLVPELNWPGAPDIRYVFPHAPLRPVTINGGMPMRAWYDIVSLGSGRDHDQQGIADSVNQAARLLRRERDRGIAADRIVVAGFSQGGAIALQLALRFPEKLAGLIALSTYLLLDHRLPADAHPANLGLPVFVGHGSQDPMVPCRLGEHVAERLRGMGYAVEWHSYAMPHSVCPQEVADLAAWLRARLG